jgi:hypothetical protein
MAVLDGDATMAKLVPYYAWNNRGNASMLTWFPTSVEQARESLADAAFDNACYGRVEASSVGAAGTVAALSDGHRPQSANDQSIDRWQSDDLAADEHVVTLAFPARQAVESVGVYWYQNGAVELPESWGMEYRNDGEWRPFELYVTDFFGTDLNRYVVIHPAAQLSCEALRLRIRPQAGRHVGLLDLDLKIARKTMAG